MLIRIKPSWEISENQVTDETDYFQRSLSRRQMLDGAAKLGVTSIVGWGTLASPVGLPKALAVSNGFPAPRNPLYDLNDPARPMTQEKYATTYNNFYEFTLKKNEVHKKVESWKVGSWPIQISGLVEKPLSMDLEDLTKKFKVEERIYRFRCVETWAMVVPWTGFPLSELVKLAKPTSKAKFVKFTTLSDKKVMPSLTELPYYPWPYTEGLTIEEALHPLAFLATGLYGKPLPRQNGAPVRLVVPWKYGFKSIKSIVSIEFVSARPKTLWNQLAPEEYGFFANVNPEVSHPRWSQAKENLIDGSFFPKKIPTLKFNGYEKEVAHLYKEVNLTQEI